MTDAAVVTAGDASAGVACGVAGTCTADQKCCVETTGALQCVALADPCSGVSAACDGVEDCDGAPCCLQPSGAVIACGTGACDDQICRSSVECKTGVAHTCCFNAGTSSEPWGRCRSACPP